MTIGNMAKYAQNPLLRKYLFETGESVLVEASPDDIYWGVGIVSTLSILFIWIAFLRELTQLLFGI